MHTNFRVLDPIHLAALFIAFLLPALGQEPDTKTDAKKNQPLVRFICVSAFAEEQQVVLASRDEEGKWLEHGSSQLRSSFVTEWLPATRGELQLALREGQTLRSIGSFTYPADCRRALAILIPDMKKTIYNIVVVDPEKIKFGKGSLLTINFSKQTGLIALGTNKIAVPSGQKVVAKPKLEANGMYRMIVAYQDASDKIIQCCEHYLPGNTNSRDMLFLFPDKSLGLKTFSLPMLGDFD